MYSKKRRRNDLSPPRRSSLQVNLSFVSDSSDTDPEINTPKNNSDSLDDNVKRLREAILTKTREIFDNQNDFCQKTASILGKVADQNDQNESNSQEKKNLVIEDTSSNDFHPKPSTSKTTNNEKLIYSPIMSSSNKNPRSLRLSPRRTRSMRSLRSNKDDTLMGNPITSSTFTTHNSSVKPKSNDNEECRTPKSSKPVIRTVRSCYVPLDKIGGFERGNRSRNLKEIPMELTPAVGNVLIPRVNERVHNPGMINLQSNESFSSVRTSMEVRTSVDGVLNDSGSRLNIDKCNQSVSSQSSNGNGNGSGNGNGNQRRSLSLKRFKWSGKVTHPALMESQDNSRSQSSFRRDERSSLNANTSVGCRKSLNCSVVESTPYPVSRSTLVKSQSRFLSILEKKSRDSKEEGGRSRDGAKAL